MKLVNTPDPLGSKADMDTTSSNVQDAALVGGAAPIVKYLKDLVSVYTVRVSSLPTFLKKEPHDD